MSANEVHAKPVRLSIDAQQRTVLLDELHGVVATTAALYRQIGREWDPGNASSHGPEVAPIVRARDQLSGRSP